MEIESIVIPATNDFASLYMEQKEPVKGFFHYDITENGVYEKRYKDLMKREFNRKGLATCIKNYMERFPMSNATKKSLEKLQNDNSTVVIGGQQAGLLTGPLYTIHKVISIIKLAEQQEKKLGTPVIPVFWIAGEDHDFLEINHVYTEAGHMMKKINYPEQNGLKQMASDIVYNKEEMQKWLETIFMHLGERKYTKEVFSSVLEASNRSETITDFFTMIIMSLFKDYGLLVIDAADSQLRELEKPFFSKVIDQASEITEKVIDQQELIQHYGFNRMLEIQPQSANLFLYEEKDRLLLDYDADLDRFKVEKINWQMDRQELSAKLKETPELFSNNVVTRPLMQESLFPSLAFIAGPGEIAYWGELKQAFELWDMKMPPLVPRINITFIESNIERDLAGLQLSIENVLKNGVEKHQIDYLDSVTDHHIETVLDEINQYLEERYQSIFERLHHTERGLLPIAEKNLAFHTKQIEFLKKKADWFVKERYKSELEKYERIERCLRPNGSPQERVWNIFYYLNDRGYQFIHQLMSLSYEFDGKHKMIKI
ncbi:bacillithiol biosynthesis cysteine-adding enzyme BshC [Lederbergia galactosidilytica]|uniref:Putative cysteine ligase BshC n=1 Tax=Lederbergia galactosidilytica TaxID=217031 RepID=A0A177ZHJ6_9BACI|nr:bacillithiol biosynthesis cysteine-adding enzyme BshC [Lederbergia galactosidilytica]OAK67073.1 bacillithiol biosynthesis cysteine-adding enzyme BshC [Lederbergia galactosidilytica]